MKRIILTIFAAFLLSACGGGGGAAPSMNSDDSRVVLTPEQREREALQREANDLSAKVNALGSGNQAEKDLLLDEIDSLLAKINAQSETIDNLRNEIATLQDRIVKVAVSPPVEISPPPTCNGANEEANGGNCVCVADYSRKNGVCEKDVPPPPTCNGANEEANGGNCVCVSGYVRQNGVCEPEMPIIPPIVDSRPIDEFDSLEFRSDPVLSLANPLPAYRRNAFGQGVTVMLVDTSVNGDHEDLAEQFDKTPLTLTGQENRFKRGQHGTTSAGILGAIRGNGRGSHGIAPSVKIVPVNYGGVQIDILKHAPLNDIPIVSESIGWRSSADFPYNKLADITTHSRVVSLAMNLSPFVQGDTQYVWGVGNDGLRTTIIQPATRYAYLPFVEENLADNIIMVVALSSDFTPDSHTNGCGVAAFWCMSAMGDGHLVPDADFYRGSNDKYRIENIGNTSAATPVVAGALALLKSFRMELSMTVIRQVLLESARPLGTRKDDGMPDEVFGWGAVDVGNGIATLMAMKTQNGILYDDLRESLPGEFAHLRGRLESVSVALRITDRSFYNMRLSDIVGGGDSDFHRNGNMGNAAEEMQTDSYKAGESFRFWGGVNYDGGKSNYIGEGGGIFSAANTEDIGGYMRWTTANYGGISAFGEYGRTAIKAEYGGNPLIAAVDNARAEEWTMGIQYRDLWRKDDNIILSARQESRISGGNMILHYPVADGDSHKAFIGETPQTIRTETTKIPIKQKPQTIWTLGYSQQTDGGKWSAATEWNTAKNESAFSFAIELQIR